LGCGLRQRCGRDRSAPVVGERATHALEGPVLGRGELDVDDVGSGGGLPSHGEVFARERRALFVGMARAMRALLVIVPEGTRSELLTGFDPAYWNMGDQGAGL